MKPSKFHSRYNPPPKVIAPIGEGGADQSFAAEADINNIMRRYALTGELVDPTSRATRHGAFMDCLTAPDSYLDAQNRVLRASEAFQSLPSAVRARFQGSVPALLEFISDPANTEEAIFLGLCEKPASQPPAAAD